ncbi:hypothetical protein UFOVP654_43 [uncultured Caudovirales phage]|uniref:Uncharacterized protein n=1 Tax=uncultured Caudovirales phage TaxID=2100421 RepID=A0A6J5NBS1_9CAUD|nr:hypothetical protein UFOVP654_43 [uncultured Caudovirales phage]
MSLASLGHTNLNSVIASLLKMGNAQRQQFAQSHADDPLMLSAAKYVDNEIKKQAQAYLAQQSGTAPPKVNEQVIQSMGPQAPPQPQPQGQPAVQAPPPPPQGQPQAAQVLPENSGIAQLPAPNLQKMAGGGIVAFARGDVVKGADGMDYYEGEGGKMLEAGSTEATIDAAKVNVPKAWNALKEGFNQIDFAGNEAGVGSALANAKAPVAAPTGPSMNPGTRSYVATPNQGRSGAPAPKVVSADVLAERLAAGKAPAGSAQPPMPTMKNTSDSDILATYQRIQKDINPDVTVDPYAAQTEANRADAASVGQRQLSDATAREQGLAALLSKREGRIQEREGRIQGAEDLNTKMSIINAGLAMMQSTGKGLAGIAEGATVGARQYGEGKKATELARQKIEDARDAFDELRFNQEGMTAKEKTAAVAAITSASITARTAAVKNMQDKQGLTAKQATDLFDNTIKAQLEKQRMENQLKLEAMQQGGANARTATQEAGANARTDKQIASQVTKFNPMTSYADYLKGFAGKETITPPMSYADYVAQFAPPKMVNVPDANLKP